MPDRPHKHPYTPYIIRRLSASDGERYREIRLEGLRLHPEAFGAAFEEETKWPASQYSENLAKSVVFGGSRMGSDEIDGVVGFAVQAGAKLTHKGKLWGMYVRSAARESGLGEALIIKVIDHASPVVEEIKLAVAASSDAAYRLYVRAGFRCYGTETGALKVDGRYMDEILMSRPITFR